MNVFLKNKISQRLNNGHPWVFLNEINSEGLVVEGGEVVDVFGQDKKFLGRGFINLKSQIAVRLLTRNRDEIIDADFFYRRLLQAKNYKNQLGYVENCRLVFGEADFLPGLIIDKFNDYIVIQTLALGMDIWKPAIVDALVKIFNPKGIYERNDVPVRTLEGMEQKQGFLKSPFDTNIVIRENDLQFHVDLANGQKTGYFLDQQDNRRAIRHVVKDADVLEMFCYTGTFSIHAAKYGAKKVLGVDISELAVAQAKRNAQLNGLDGVCSFEALNAFDVLKAWSKEGRQYDVVILDPPAFTKSRENIPKAVAGYKEINLRALKLIKKGGFLVTASCTNLVSPQLFLQTIESSARDARRSLRQVCFRTQSADHPIIQGMENTQYLKFLIAEVQ